MENKINAHLEHEASQKPTKKTLYCGIICMTIKHISPEFSLKGYKYTEYPSYNLKQYIIFAESFLKRCTDKLCLQSVVSPLEGDVFAHISGGKHYKVCSMKWPSGLKAQERIAFRVYERKNLTEVLQNLFWNSKNIPDDQLVLISNVE